MDNDFKKGRQILNVPKQKQKKHWAEALLFMFQHDDNLGRQLQQRCAKIEKN
jgi:hypothetical protein